MWPAEAAAVHGGRTWGVYLAVADVSDPSLARTADQVHALGYEGVGVGSLGCDEGAAETLGADPSMAVAVYVDDRASADQFLALYDGPSVGVAEVTTYCLN